MTTSDFEKIALFMGWRVEHSFTGDCWFANNGCGRSHGLVADKTSLTNDEACELLDALVEKGYHPKLERDGDDWWVCINRFDSRDGSAFKPTIPEAVSAAVLKLLVEKEGM